MENGMKTEALGVRTVSRPWSGAMDLLFMNQTSTVNAGIIIDCLCRQPPSSCGRCRRQRSAVHLSSASAATANIRRNISLRSNCIDV